MRTILTACLALGVASMSLVPVAQAAPYWQEHRESQWQARTEFREPQHQEPAWLREHCIRDWDGHELCRR